MTSINLNRTHFEDLSNEIMYEIFDFLDIYHVYEAFHDLNIRFQNLLSCSNLPININLPFLSKSNFQCYYKQFVLPNINRIRSLHLRNSFMFDHVFSSSENTKKFIGLKTIILNNILSLNHFNLLNSLSNLTSLIINQSDGMTKSQIDCHWILCLPVLKYCKISTEGIILFRSVSDTSNQLSTIEHLIINSGYDIEELSYLLSCLPHLRRLSIDYLYRSRYSRMRIISPVFNKLTHVSFKLKDMKFNRFEPFLLSFLRNIQVLRISTNDDSEYMNADRWERLITLHLVNLRIFDIQHAYYITDDNDELTCDDRIKQFSSSFWIKRQWYFEYQHPAKNNGSHYGMFYSTQPYRRRYYEVYGKHNQNRHRSNEYHLVHHVHISNRSPMNNCSIFFPNARELTICANNYLRNDELLITALDRIVPFDYLNKIIINNNAFDFKTLVQILYFTPNCYQLILKSLILHESDILSISHDPRFRLTSNVNKTTDLVIKSKCTCEQMKLLTKLCPRIQHLTIEVLHEEFSSIIKYLFSKSNKNTCHLVSLYIQSTSDIYIEKLMYLLEPLKRSNDFAVQDIGYKSCYIWW